MREIVLDTETTGLSAASGDRIIEIACLELVNHLPTGKQFQCYLNPERPVSSDAFAIHGLGDEFLADKPRFGEILEELFAFIADSPLVIHNAEFDVGFVNAELARLERPPLPIARATDTVAIARRKFPGAPASLDALCRRFGIDNSERTKHGALLDAELLAEVYIDLIGARQSQLILATETRDARAGGYGEMPRRVREVPLAPRVTDAEREAHRTFVATLGDKPIWNDFLGG